MDSCKGKGKKGLISKTWARCKSFPLTKLGNNPLRLVHKSKSWPCSQIHGRVVPQGCFTIYVGPERERFVIKTKYVNHPLFKTLLEEAEFEYGYSSDGPLLLPCEVHYFVEVMTEMESQQKIHKGNGCRSFVARSHGYHHLLTPSRSLTI